MRACNKQRSKIPLGTKGRTSILSYREYRASCGASFPVSRRKLLDRECCVTSFRQGGKTHGNNDFLGKRNRCFRVSYHLALLKRLSPVDLPSANGFDKPFAASKFED